MNKDKVMILILKKAIPNLKVREIMNFLKYEKSAKLYLKHSKILKETEKDFNNIDNALKKVSQKELNSIKEQVLKPYKEINKEISEYWKEFHLK